MTVAALFVRADSVYKEMPGVDAWDVERDARGWPGGAPVVAHPPCRAWGSLRGLAKPRPDEKDLARWAVAQVRKFGGVLEHPAASPLWKDQALPEPGAIDAFGGRTIEVDQHRWGHLAEKMTRFYVVGLRYPELVAMIPPKRPERPTHVVTNIHGLRHGMPGHRPELSKRPREHTPRALAEWLVVLASRCAL
jgi:hypothetical protein